MGDASSMNGDRRITNRVIPNPFRQPLELQQSAHELDLFC